MKAILLGAVEHIRAVESHTSLTLPILRSHSLGSNLEHDDDDDNNSYLPNYVNVTILLLTKKEFFKNKDLSSTK